MYSTVQSAPCLPRTILFHVKRLRGEPGHTRDTHGTRGRTKAHGSHRRTVRFKDRVSRMCVPWCPVCVPAPTVSFFKTVQRHREPGHTHALPVQTGGAGTCTERSKSSPVNASQVKSSLDSTASLESTFNNRLKVAFCICSDLT
jgi:hypothetical protein